MGLGPSNLSPFDGESAENRWVEDVDGSALAAGVEKEATDPVEGLRRPIKDMESRFDLRGRTPPLLVLPVAWRGSRDVDVEGDDRASDWYTDDLGVVPSSLITPNSEVDKPVGEGFAEEEASPLARLVVDADECLRGGDGTAEAALEIRGILVGVSFGKLEAILRAETEGSLFSLALWETLFVVPTEGEPAIVGS